MHARIQKSLAAALLAVCSLSSHGAAIFQNSGQFDAAIQFYEPIGQSFVAQDPFLSTIGFAFSDINPVGHPNEPITMTIRQGSGLGGTVVRSVTQTLPAVLPSTSAPPLIIDFNFSGTALNVGQPYTVSVTVPSSAKVGVVYSGTDVFAGGQLFKNANNLTGGPPGGPSTTDCGALCDLNFSVVPGTILLPNATVAPTTANSPNGFTPVQTFVFIQPQPRNIFDPPFADGFLYELIGGGNFLEVAGVPGFFGLDVVANGVLLDSDLNPGESFLFGGGVSAFSLLGITPPVDAGDPTAFPTFLDFSGSPAELNMTALVAVAANGVPEPGSLALLGAALGALGLSRRRKKN